MMEKLMGPMEKTYRPYDPDQLFLLPPALQDWVPAGHLAHFLSDIVDELNVNAILIRYEQEARGYPPYHPRMMTKLLLYAYAVGIPSSRKIAQRCEEDLAFRVLTANQTPDFRTISEFRQRHLEALTDLFVQVLQICRRAGLVKLGVVALDGTKIRANASKHRAMSYGRMQTEVPRLEAEVATLLRQAAATDQAEDRQHGAASRGDELPAEVAHREQRLARIRAAKAALEAEAQATDPGASDAPRRGRPRRTPPGVPRPTAQRNFTDPDSRIMKDADQAFIQGYNAQAAVDAHAQIIVACAATNQAADAPHAVPVMEQIVRTSGTPPRVLLADAGYCSDANITAVQAMGSAALIATRQQRHGERLSDAPRGRPPVGLTVRERMQRRLRTRRGRQLYAQRKAIVEPVFGLIKRARGFRQFLLRGLAKVQAEWTLICLTQNLLTLYRRGWSVPT
jgi:transposase